MEITNFVTVYLIRYMYMNTMQYNMWILIEVFQVNIKSLCSVMQHNT